MGNTKAILVTALAVAILGILFAGLVTASENYAEKYIKTGS